MNDQAKGADLLRSQMHAALDAGETRRYLALRRQWARTCAKYGCTTIAPAFETVEAPAVSPTLDR